MSNELVKAFESVRSDEAVRMLALVVVEVVDGLFVAVRSKADDVHQIFIPNDEIMSAFAGENGEGAVRSRFYSRIICEGSNRVESVDFIVDAANFFLYFLLSSSIFSRGFSIFNISEIARSQIVFHVL